MSHSSDNMDLAGLLDRVSKATGPDAYLDFEIDLALKGQRNVGGWQAEVIATGERINLSHVSAPPYTGSIDAALALVEKVLPGWVWTVAARNTAPEHGRPWADVASLEWIEAGDDAIGCEYAEASAATPALALLSALLSALTSLKASS